MWKRRGKVSAGLVADVNEGAARAAAEKFQVKQVYRDAEQLLASPDVQAVILALPTGLRTPLALSALKHRKHVLLEKPAAASVAELKQMRAAAGDRVVAVASSRFRTYPVAQVARDAVRAGDLGAIRVIRCRAVLPAGEAPTTPPPVWRLSKRLNGGGILVNWGVYDLDFLLRTAQAVAVPQGRSPGDGPERATDPRGRLGEGHRAMASGREVRIDISRGSGNDGNVARGRQGIRRYADGGKRAEGGARDGGTSCD